MTAKKSLLLIFFILLIDQISKIYIKTHFILGEQVQVFSGFSILFIENEGMAWGAKLSDLSSVISDRTAKLLLTLFRVLALFGVGYWLMRSLAWRGTPILSLGLSLIFAGALGNIIDSLFYGLLFGDSQGQIAQLFPNAGGYEQLFYGRVVDMLYFPVWKGFLPEWIPFVGGKYISFFDPVFNLADVSISGGFAVLVLFHHKAFPKR